MNQKAETFAPDTNILDQVRAVHFSMPIHAVFVDEAQFLSRAHVRQLSDVVDQLSIQVSTYGLRSDFKGKLFEGSAALMALADVLAENTGVCATGKKATWWCAWTRTDEQ